MISRPRSVIGALASWSWLSRFRNRSLIFGGLIAFSLVISAFPERYLAYATMTPADPGSLGLGGALGQLGAGSSVFGSQVAAEMALRVGMSDDVREIVIQKLNLTRRLHKSDLQLHRWLKRHVEVRALRGGILEVDMQSIDARLADDVIKAYTYALQDRIGELSREQTATKRQILEQLVREATDGFAEAQQRYDNYRLTHQEAIPETQTETVAQRILSLESTIRGKQVALATAHQMYTDENFNVKQLRAEIAELQRQLAETKATEANGSQDVGTVVASTRVLFKLQRELSLQRALYDSYMRFLQGTTVEDLASTANIRILEPPHVDTARQFWLPAVAMAVAFALLWGAIEFYRLRPPLGASLPH